METCLYKFLAHPICTTRDFKNLNITDIRSPDVIIEERCNKLLNEAKGKEMNGANFLTPGL